MTRLNRLPCASRTGYIMGNTMTVTAFCILFMNCNTVWFSMAILAFRKLTMCRMTLCAGEGRVFCDMILQQLICLVMTTGTDFLALGNRIGYLQRGVHRVARQTVRGCQYCHGAVIFVTFSTLGNAAMFFRMTGGAFLFRVLADLCLQAGSYLCMAELAAAFQVGRSRDGCQGLVWIDMAFQALCHRFC